MDTSIFTPPKVPLALARARARESALDAGWASVGHAVAGQAQADLAGQARDLGSAAGRCAREALGLEAGAREALAELRALPGAESAPDPALAQWPEVDILIGVGLAHMIADHDVVIGRDRDPARDALIGEVASLRQDAENARAEAVRLRAASWRLGSEAEAAKDTVRALAARESRARARAARLAAELLSLEWDGLEAREAKAKAAKAARHIREIGAATRQVEPDRPRAQALARAILAGDRAAILAAARAVADASRGRVSDGRLAVIGGAR